MLDRIRNLWRKAAAPQKSWAERYKEKLIGKKMATIVETKDIEMFPDHQEHI